MQWRTKIKEMIKVIRKLLKDFLDKIDDGECDLSVEEQIKILRYLSALSEPDQRMSKVQACDYIGVSRSTFDKYVHDGLIPKGEKVEGFKELSWYRSDLECFLLEQEFSK